jgi:hypothetical protein
MSARFTQSGSGNLYKSPWGEKIRPVFKWKSATNKVHFCKPLYKAEDVELYEIFLCAKELNVNGVKELNRPRLNKHLCVMMI